MTDDQLDIFASPNNPDPAKAPPPNADLGRFPYPVELTDHLVLSGLSRGRIRLAYALVAMEPDLSDARRRALFMAVIIGLEAQSQGSTFVPLPSKTDYFSRRLNALIPQKLIADHAHWAPDTLIETLCELFDDPDGLRILGQGDEFRPLVISDGRLYHQRMMLFEARLVEAVADRLAQPDLERDPDTLETALDEVRRIQPPGHSGEPIVLTGEQQYALLTALHRPMTLITGGPGTGKTSIIVSILRLLVRLGISPGAIALAAPTGKAANRMAESIYSQLDALEEPMDIDQRLGDELEKPRTLHRLMGYSPRRDEFNHHAGNPLAHRMVIVDESSMIDLFLMERLLRAVSPTAQLVLLGDADQLPSVDTGAVLRDLIPDVVSTDAPWRPLVDGDLPTQRGTAPTADAAVRLIESFRMRKEDPAGREILTFARAIRDYDQNGDLHTPQTIDDIGDLDRFPDGARLWEPVRGADDQPDLSPFIDWWMSQIVLDGDPGTWRPRFNHTHQLDADRRLTDDAKERIHRLLDHYARARVLTLTRVFATGSERLNDEFHRKTARFGRTRQQTEFDFHPGEPIMMLRNDYDRNLFNGDQGVVVWCKRTDADADLKPDLMAVFERTDDLIAYPLTELREDLEHAFAMTVHKAQGSEFQRVAMVLPGQPMALLNRELLYTGLTRASKGVLIAGSPRLLNNGAANHNERFSAVAQRLASSRSSR